MQVWQIGSQVGISCFATPMRFRRSPWLAVHEVPERIGIDLEHASDFSQAMSLLVEALNLPEPLVQVLSSLVLGRCQTKVRRPWFTLLGLVPTGFSRGLLERYLTPQEPIKRVGQITNEVPAICYLHSIGCAQSSSLGIGASTVSADHFDSRMLPEPPGKRFSAAVSQQINRPMRTQIHQNGSVGVATPQRKIIDAKDAWCLRGVGACSFDSSQERVSANCYSHVLDQMCSCLSAERTAMQSRSRKSHLQVIPDRLNINCIGWIL